MTKNKIGSVVKLTTILYLIVLVVAADAIKGCKGGRRCNDRENLQQEKAAPAMPVASTKGQAQYETFTNLLTVADIRVTADGQTEVIFSENTAFFNVEDKAVASALKEAFSKGKPMDVTFDPWQHIVLKAEAPTAEEQSEFDARQLISSPQSARKINLATMRPDVIDQPSEMAVINKTSGGLVNVIPDFTTAQMMFDYITKQCCALPAPYGVDTCISFQYCQDGCYARAHKMCSLINKRFNYGTQKIFSFANAGSDQLCVQGQKWGGCCIRWWYHVAPLVTIQTTTGPKAFVFDPAMFNQPVLLSTWLHAQENPTCVLPGKVPNVSMINVQPTSAYTPSGSSGYVFTTDPSYKSTNKTHWNYRNKITCP
jgi:hypothetical protein